MKSKFITGYVESDLATIIHDTFANLESPEGAKFNVKHVDEGTVLVTISNQIFIINVMEKGRLS